VRSCTPREEVGGVAQVGDRELEEDALVGVFADPRRLGGV